MTKAHQRPAVRRTAVAGLAVMALGLTAACGGSSSGNDRSGASSAGSSTGSSATANASAQAGSDEFAPGSKVDAASVKKMFGDAISAASTVHVDMTMTGQIQMSGSGEMDMKSKPVRADLQLASSTLGSKDIRMLMVDNAMYLHMAQLGEKYIKVSLGGKNSPLSQLGLSSLDPTAMFDRFSDAFTGGTYVGKETIDGTSTDHYRLDVDTKALTSALPSAAPTAASGAASGAASAMPTTESVDVWFDGDGRYKQMKMSADGEDVTESFSGWGKAVSVKAPPASQVQDMTGMVGGLMASQGTTPAR